MRKFFCLLLLSSSILLGQHYSYEEDEECSDSCQFRVNELGIGTGFAYGEMKQPQDPYKVVPLFIHIGFDLNPICGIGYDWGTFQVALQPFWNAVLDPLEGIETGLGVKLLYYYPITDSWSIYLEGGAGPGYLSIRTREQSAAGFNFFDEGGGGLKFFYCSCSSLNLGYRIRHISHAGLRSEHNSGIDSHAFIVSLSAYY